MKGELYCCLIVSLACLCMSCRLFAAVYSQKAASV